MRDIQIPLFKVYMSNQVDKFIMPVLNSGYITQGTKVLEFENLLSKYTGHDRLITTNSATSADHLALHLIKNFSDLYSEDRNEVISTPLTCTATNWPILANNLNIKWADINVENLNIDLDDVYEKVSEKTLAVMIVYWGGNPIDNIKLQETKLRIQKKIGYCPLFIHDCAHAFGAKVENNYLGNEEDFYFFSFQAIKHLTCGDGGALLCPNNFYYEKAKLIRWFGIDRNSNKKDYRCENDICDWGYKFHMNDISASIGISNLNHIDEILYKHRSNANFYDRTINENDNVKKIIVNAKNESSYWIYTICVKNRDSFMDYMKSKGIIVSQVHLRNDLHSCVKKYKSNLPNLESISENYVSIPVGWWLNYDDINYISASVNEWSSI